MATILFLALLVQSVFQFPQMVGDELDEDTHELMQQREEYLTQQMNRLLQELEQQSHLGRSAPRFATLHQWQFWVIAVMLVLILSFWWWLRKRIQQTDSSSDDSRTKDNARTMDKYERRQSLVVDVRRASVAPFMGLSDSFPAVAVDKLVRELLCICRKHCGDSFMPLPQPAIRMATTSESWGPHEHHAVYCMLVPLKPPRGHNFHLELDTREILGNIYRTRVELECTCAGEQLEENMLCFLHRSKEELRRNQGPSLLDTLCTGPYLDREKTTRWFQILVKGASVVLLQPTYWRTIVLPSKYSCKIQLTNASGNTILIEMVLGVQRGYTFLSIE
ncbi:PREDICTED: inositol 1,4,5-trisphosphate receptor-interacting protein-like 1 [Calidris pugnax]|uniref:inositol 1,4,5-trisphosphate receptor-interacting protein-like 1 n=1 Tax=Calidris pugnax TaxID=198806 RepID=UPI00071DC770|nr:PREDICTED: inositol 1,4,5-trisphosphate receptor-interacting protein-like 1 [Calidris pugnax]